MNKNIHKKRKLKMGSAPLFVVTSFSVLAFLLIGVIVPFFTDYSFILSWDHPAFASILIGEKDIVYAATPEDTYNEEELAAIKAAADIMAEESEAEPQEYEVADLEDEEDAAEVVAEEPEEEGMTAAEEELLKQMYMNEYGRFPYSVFSGTVTQFVNWNDNATRSYYYTNMSVRPVSNAYPYKKVDPEYFKDSLFIGDSRMKGFSDYCGWEEGNFVYKIGLNVFNMMSTSVQSRNGKTTVMDELTARQYENVYLCIGINELGSGTVDMFQEKYGEILGIIRDNQPDARIIIMSIMYETPSYSESQSVYNNDNINAKNVAISRFANGEDIFYLDVNPSVADDTRMALTESYSFDGIHMAAKYYAYWADFMCTHAY